jgi:hypothetical protein
MSLEPVHDPFTIEPVKKSLYSSDSASFAVNNCSVPSPGTSPPGFRSRTEDAVLLNLM